MLKTLQTNLPFIMAAGVFAFAGSPAANAATSADTDFQTRCSAGGVLVCEGFDNYDAASFPPSCGGNWPTSANPRCYNPAADGKTHAFLDQTVYASGDAGTGKHAALRLDTTNVADANVAGDFFIRWPQVFSQNSHFYVQYRMRMHGYVTGSTGNWTSPDIGGQGWKTMVFAAQNGPLCGGIELATVNFDYANQLRLYTRCSSTIYDNFEFGSNYQRQQGNYTCVYNDPNPQANCAMFHGDQWMTFYYDVTVGTFGQNNSYIKVFIDYGDGQGYRQWIDAPNYRLDKNGSNSDGWGLADFTNYNTGKNSSKPSPSTYSTWYDEFILSTKPIAAPGATSTETPLMPPQNLHTM